MKLEIKIIENKVLSLQNSLIGIIIKSYAKNITTKKIKKSMDVKSISLNRLLDIILSEITIFFEKSGSE